MYQITALKWRGEKKVTKFNEEGSVVHQQAGSDRAASYLLENTSASWDCTQYTVTMRSSRISDRR